MRILISLLTLCTLAACGGSGGGGGGSEPQTFGVSGFVMSGVTDSAVAGVTMTVSGATSATTTTDGTGQYTFTGLRNGNYTVAPSLADAEFSPTSQAVTISGAGIANQDFLAFRGAIVASGVEFLPQSFSSADQLRASVVVVDNSAVFTDSSDFPLKKQPLDGAPITALANRFGGAESVVLHGDDLIWVGDGNLHKTSSDGTTIVLIYGQGGSQANTTTDIVVDNAYAYWVDTVPTGDCSPPCTRVIQKVSLDGSTVETLATVRRRVASLASDADSIYWEEASVEPVAPDCNCGSAIKSVPKAGGATVVLVDGMLNGTLPPVPPGYIPASWRPIGGIIIAGSEIVFGVVGTGEYRLQAIPVTGGDFRSIANVPTSSVAAVHIKIEGASLYWIDVANSTLNTAPLAGGSVTLLASDLNDPGTLAVNSSTAFWTEPGDFSGCCLQAGTGSIKQIPLAGGPVIDVVSGLDRPRALAVDGSNLAWTEVWRVAKAALGGDVTTVASGVTSNMARIAIAQSNVYVLDGSFIKVVPLAGGVVEKLASAHFGAIGDISPSNADIVADTTHLYWTVRNSIGTTRVQKVALSGGAPITLYDTFNVPKPQDCYWRIAVDEQNVYWSEGSATHPIGCAVKKVPINGGAVTTLVDHPYLADFTVNGTNLYFSDFASRSIERISIDGGALTSVAESVSAWVMVNFANRLYWLGLPPEIGFPSELGSISTSGDTTPSEWDRFPISVENDRFLAIEGLFVGSSGVYVSETQTGSIYSIY